MPTPNSIQIRSIYPSDVEAYYPLRLRALREHPEAFSSLTRSKPGWRRAILPRNTWPNRRRTASCWGHGWTGAGGQPGLVPLEWGQDPPGGRAGPHVRGPGSPPAGIGWRLLQAVLERARQLPGLELVSLGVMSENTEAIGLYRKAGFVQTAVVPKALKLDGRYYDAVLMMLELP